MHFKNVKKIKIKHFLNIAGFFFHVFLPGPVAVDSLQLKRDGPPTKN